MKRNNNLSIAQRNLSKNKKYYSYRTVQKDKQNILEGDIRSIVQKLSKESKLPTISVTLLRNKYTSPMYQILSNRKSLQKSRFNQNSPNFFEQNQLELMVRKDIRKDLLYYINKLKRPVKTKRSFYQQYLYLSQETNDYLEYYLTNFTGQDPGRATQLLKQKGKTIILFIFKKQYKCFQTNPQQISNRVFISFHLNPLNDFQFISWEKFMKLKKLISQDFNRRDYIDFLLNYFFIEPKKSISGSEFWLIFTSVIRKLSTVVDTSALEILIQRIKQSFIHIIPETQQLTQEKFQKIILEQSKFIWHQFVTLIFV